MKPLLFLICLFIAANSIAQFIYRPASLNNIENEVKKGDINALRQLAPFLDSQGKVNEYLGEHILTLPLNQIALRIIDENSLFWRDELTIDTTLNCRKFLAFIDAHPQLCFDTLSETFLVTPVREKNTPYELRYATRDAIHAADSLLNARGAFWYHQGVKELWEQKDSKALLMVASEWYRHRFKFNNSYFNEDEFISAIKLFTHLEVAVPSSNGHFTYLYDFDFRNDAKLNYLIFWSKAYDKFTWNDSCQCFTSCEYLPRNSTREEELFELLRSKNSVAAFDAYVQLSAMDETKVTRLAKDYDHSGFDFQRNDTLSSFCYKFLEQLVKLTAYCRKNGLEYLPTKLEDTEFKKLLEFLPYKESYELENYFIDNLTSSQITKLEFFAIMHLTAFNNDISFGRIIDKYYSKNWKSIISDHEQLLLYLKKAYLFQKLSIHGICNHYKKKFYGSSDSTINTLRKLREQTEDEDIRNEIDTVLAHYLVEPVRTKPYFHKWIGDDFYSVKDLASEYRAISRSDKTMDQKGWDLEKLLSRINYQQIGKALEILKKDKYLLKPYPDWRATYDQYRFLKEDFGFPVDPGNNNDIQLFQKLYHQLPQNELYTYYLKNSGFDYRDQTGKLDYQKIYEILKFDASMPFLGVNRRDDYIYPIIKLLELEFGTTLFFPAKQCNSANTYGCDIYGRTRAWMDFLVSRGFAHIITEEPISICEKD